MKTKLLKKIRKRFVIEKYTYVHPNENVCLDIIKEDLGLPFFLLTDKEDYFYTLGFKNINDAKNEILKYMRKYYSSASKNVRSKSKKVWYLI